MAFGENLQGARVTGKTADGILTAQRKIYHDIPIHGFFMNSVATASY
jgi:hypothetical protein